MQESMNQVYASHWCCSEGHQAVVLTCSEHLGTFLVASAGA